MTARLSDRPAWAERAKVLAEDLQRAHDQFPSASIFGLALSLLDTMASEVERATTQRCKACLMVQEQ